jgi:hypothetical protein
MSGSDVSWYSILKAPKAVSDKQGLEFMYLDSKTDSAIFEKSLLNTAGALSYTLSQLNNNSISSFLFK